MTNETTPGMSEQTPPPVIGWFKVYAGVMTGIYVLCMLVSPFVFWVGIRTHTEERGVIMFQGALLLVIGVVFAIAFALPFFLARKPWVWIYNLVIICIGLTSCCILPAAVPLLIYWVKPETKAWFNRA